MPRKKKKNIFRMKNVPKKKVVLKAEVPVNEVSCPDCKWKAGLMDAHTLCEKCNGSGLIVAKPLA